MALTEEDHGQPATLLYGGEADLVVTVKLLFGEDTEEIRANVCYGSSMIIHMKKGKGEVFSATTTEWFKGLEDHNPFVEIITRNVLDKYSREVRS